MHLGHARASFSWPSAGTKSPEDTPCRYSNGSTSVTCGVLRAHDGKTAQDLFAQILARG